MSFILCEKGVVITDGNIITLLRYDKITFIEINIDSNLVAFVTNDCEYIVENVDTSVAIDLLTRFVK